MHDLIRRPSGYGTWIWFGLKGGNWFGFGLKGGNWSGVGFGKFDIFFKFNVYL